MISLYIGIGALLLLAIGFILATLNNKKTAIFVSIFVVLFATSLYQYLGNSRGLHNAMLLQAFNNEEEVLPELMQGLQKQLQQHPDDPITLTLLGKIYFTVGDYKNASITYSKAYKLSPDDEELLIDYATADFLAKDGVIDPELNHLLVKVKQLKPSIQNLSLLANVALTTGDNKLAIEYWQQMQKLAPKDSPLYQELQATIEFAS